MSKVPCIHCILAPDAQISLRFALRPAIFGMVVKNRKCTEWPQNDFKHLTVKSTLYTVNTHPQGPNCTPFCSTISQFLRYKDVENRKCTKWPQNDLKHLSVKIYLHTLNTYPRGPNLTPFTLRSLVLQIIAVFGFHIGYNGKFQKFVKNWKPQIHQFEKIQMLFEGGVAFWNFCSIGFHVNENEKKNREK